MTLQEVVTALNNLSDDDPESAHDQAEGIVMEFPASNGMGELSDAFEKARHRIGFYYS